VGEKGTQKCGTGSTVSRQQSLGGENKKHCIWGTSQLTVGTPFSGEIRVDKVPKKQNLCHRTNFDMHTQGEKETGGGSNGPDHRPERGPKFLQSHLFKTGVKKIGEKRGEAVRRGKGGPTTVQKKMTIGRTQIKHEMSGQLKKGPVSVRLEVGE